MALDPILRSRLLSSGREDVVKRFEEDDKRNSFGKLFTEEFKRKSTSFSTQAAKITGGEKIARGLGGAFFGASKESDELIDLTINSMSSTQARKLISIGKGDLVKQEQQRLRDLSESTEDILTSGGLTSKQILGDATQLALLAATGSFGMTKSATGKLVLGSTAKTLKGIQGVAKAQKITALIASKSGRSIAEVTKQINALAAKNQSTSLEAAQKLLPLMSRVKGKAAQFAKDFAIGGAFFGAFKTAEGEEVTSKDILTGGALTAFAPPVFGAALKGAGKLISLGKNKIFVPLSEKAMGNLERIALGTTKSSRLQEARTAIDEAAAIFQPPKTFAQQAAKTTLQTIKTVKNIPTKVLNRFHSYGVYQKEAEKILGRELTDDENLLMLAETTKAVGEGKATAFLKDGFQDGSLKGFHQEMVKPNKKIQKEVFGYLGMLDEVGRLGTGKKTASGKSIDELQELMIQFRKEVGPEKMVQIEAARNTYKKYQRRLLSELADSGLINKETEQTLINTYPDYIPHSIVAETVDDAIIRSGAGESLNVSQNGLKRALGSERAIANPYEAIIKRAAVTFDTAEKNRTMNALVGLRNQAPDAFKGMAPLRTAEQVEKRVAIASRLKVLRTELRAQYRKLVSSNKFNKKQQTTINALEKKIDDADDQIRKNLETFFAEDSTLIRETQEKARVITIPNELLDDAKAAARFKSKAEFIKSNIAGRKFEEGILENLGIKSREEFWEISRNQFKKTPAGRVLETEITKARADVALGKAVSKKIQKARLEEFYDTQGLKKMSSQDSVDFLQREVDEITSIRKDLLAEVKQLSDTKKSAVALSEEGLEKISYFNKGIREDWVVPADLGEAIKNLDSEQLPTLLKIAAIPADLLRAGATRFNLSFAIPNFARDAQTALITSELSSQGIINAISKGPRAKQMQQLWTESGGIGASIFRDARPPDAILKKLETDGHWTKMARYNPASLVKTLIEGTEKTVRESVFQAALEKGFAPRRAAWVSRNATIDFDKMGTFMRSINKVVPFLNARTQGIVNVGKALARNPEAFSRRMMYTAAYPTMVLQRHNRQYDSYNQVPTWVKNKFWVIMVGETQGIDQESGAAISVPQFVTVPKGEGQQLLANPIQYFLDFADGNDPRSVDEMILSTLGDASPVSFGSYSSSNRWGSFIANFGPLAGIPAGLFSNRVPFTGASIIPESRKEAGSKELQFNPNKTREFSKDLAGYANMSPANLEFILTSFGGLPTDILDLTEHVFYGNLPRKAESDTAFGVGTTIPVIRTFLREAGARQGVEAEKARAVREEVVGEVKDRSIIIQDIANDMVKDIRDLQQKGASSSELLDVYRTNLDRVESKEDKIKLKDKFIEVRAIKELSLDVRKNDSNETKSLILSQKMEGKTRKEMIEIAKTATKTGMYSLDAIKDAIKIVRRKERELEN